MRYRTRYSHHMATLKEQPPKYLSREISTCQSETRSVVACIISLKAAAAAAAAAAYNINRGRK